MTFLRQQTGVHIHADLIAGLPGEDWDSFARGFDAVFALNPQEIQVGILKRLRGTRIGVHDEGYGMRYAELPPYEVIQTSHMSKEQLDFIKKLASLWDRIANSGYFVMTLPLLFEHASPIQCFTQFTRWFYNRHAATYGLSLSTLENEIFAYLTEVLDQAPETAANALISDRLRLAQTVPRWLKALVPHPVPFHPPKPTGGYSIPKRQARHLQVLP
jgi:hypothetical protein